MYPSLTEISQFIAGVGIPGVVAIGLIFILDKGLRILSGIADTLERMDETLKTTVCPFNNNPTLVKEITCVNNPSVASRLPSQGTVQPAGS